MLKAVQLSYGAALRTCIKHESTVDCNRCQMIFLGCFFEEFCLVKGV